PVRARRLGDRRYRLRAWARHRQRAVRRLPAARRADQSGQLGRPDVQPRRRGDRGEHGDRLAHRRIGRHRLRDPERDRLAHRRAASEQGAYRPRLARRVGFGIGERHAWRGHRRRRQVRARGEGRAARGRCGHGDQRRADRQRARPDPRGGGDAARQRRAPDGAAVGARDGDLRDRRTPPGVGQRLGLGRGGKKMRILVVEDDKDVAGFVVRGLREAGHVVEHAGNGRDGLFMAASESFDAVILDRMLPGGVDGLRLLETLRAQKNAVPVLFLSALAEVDDRVKGLRAGGDDYLTKPFAFSELLARVEALARRGKGDGPITRLQVGDLELDLLSRQVKRAGQKIDLQPREFRLLEYLMRHAGQVVTRTMLLEGVWDYHFDPQTNVIDVHVSRLRQKVDKPFPSQLIHTVRNAGYMLK